MEEAATETTAQSYYGTTPDNCKLMIGRALSKNSMVKYMRDAIEKAGCSVPDKFFKPMECTIKASGGFIPEEGIVICSNHVAYQDEVDVALTHELIHAYDHCRGANLDWTNCEHHACSEIRAANLSGDCHWNRELLRGNTGIQAQHQVCVKRRALFSVTQNPNCPQRDAEAAIRKVWTTCYKDTQPFDRVP